MSHTLPGHEHVDVLDEAAAHSYISGVCFKHGPPRLIGIELEWFLTDPHHPARTPTAAELAALLGPHAPPSLVAGGDPQPLPRGGLVTVEPGGQVEISAPPAPSVSALVAAVRADTAALDDLLATGGLFRTARPPRAPRARVLTTARYEAMETAFDRIGPYGRRMMSGSAATQICLDLGTRAEAPARWRLAHDLGPVLLAAFAASSSPGGPVSSRMDAWWRLDPVRTAPPAGPDPADYVERVLDSPMLAHRAPDGSWQVDNRRSPRDLLAAGDPLTMSELDMHLSTLFPPVRPQGYLELRWLDAQPGEEWIVPLVLTAALFDRPATVAAALDVVRPGARRWAQATEIGLADPILSDVADALVDLADPAVSALAARDGGLDAPLVESVRQLAHRRLVEHVSPAQDLMTDTTEEAAS